ncbi:hypothetical protein CGH92_07565 [Vibrio parahaemolyticus]|uniref:TIGR04255 family protein n=1 Tax=Vibrio parahaemolyticus TaxID=670 RepID=UPI00112217E5|nr:TIGR04255 family protein [Vibrio parahaemolyticus]EJG0729933.1 TIGR04255 family protein [Vibrio parahaemolyticus]EJG0791513.1 TIGR04255 family protein [Vibrio parahaemolyticus]EJG0963330.1 TIGR04255 family protein [Vibrio parahaemolyticus]EJG1034029.1 TIGR04255 family protein [Vibrio parahaemolyticus]MBE4219780.1 TIGR04255 family protein [Vibrio parahaemolyticus]
MKKDYPLVEAIFELRWGEVAPGHFRYSNQGASGDVFLQKFTMQAMKAGYEHVEKVVDSDISPIPHRAYYRFRKQDGQWPCLQIGLGVFTVNQTAEEYCKETFLKDIEEGINAWRFTLGEDIQEVLDTLTIILRYQDFFPENEDQTEVQKLEDYFGISLTFPEKFADSAHRINSIDLSFSLKCESPDASMANISFKNAISGSKKGILADTVVFTKYNALVHGQSDIKQSIRNWIEDAHGFQIRTFEQLMEDRC